MSNLMCPVFPVFFARQGKSFRNVMMRDLASISMERVLAAPVNMGFDDCRTFGTSMVTLSVDGIKHWPIPAWQRTNDVTTLTKSIRLAVGVALDHGWVPKLDSDYVKEVN